MTREKAKNFILKFCKYLSILLINLVLIELFCFWHTAFLYLNSKEDFIEKTLPEKLKELITFKYPTISYSDYETFYYNEVKSKLRKPTGLNYNSAPYLLLGCSFAYGFGLKDDETFQTKLSEITKHPVYNYGFEWYFGLANMLWLSRSDKFYEEMPKPQNVIYVLMSDHLRRMNNSIGDEIYPFPFLHYSLRNGKLEPDKYYFYRNFQIYRKYNCYKSLAVSLDKSLKLMNEFFVETKEEFDKHWKDYKFIILVYEQNKDDKKLFAQNDWKYLQDKGFVVISTSDLIGRVMDEENDIIPDDGHPSAVAWKALTPAFVRKILN